MVKERNVEIYLDQYSKQTMDDSQCENYEEFKKNTSRSSKFCCKLVRFLQHQRKEDNSENIEDISPRKLQEKIEDIYKNDILQLTPSSISNIILHTFH